MSISRKLLSTAQDVVYESSGETAVVVAYFCNKGGSSAYINIYVTDTNDTNTANVDYSNCTIYSNTEITAGDTLILDVEKIILGSGNCLQANASANNSVVATVSWTSV
jgi:hypothetical protein